MNTFNGPSLKSVDVSFGQKIKLLALDDVIIPGQCALKYEKPNKWGVQNVWVCFEIYNKKDSELTVNI